MRILVMGINYWPDETGIGPFTTGRCEYLASRGHEVTVCTGFPYYPHWRVPKGYRSRLMGREVRNGVTILRSYLYVPKKVTSARRILHEASFIASACLRSMAAPRPDVLLTVSPPLGLGMSALLLSRRWGAPYVFHVADLQPDAALDMGMLPAGRLTRLLYAVERLAYRNAALITTLTGAMRERILSKGIVSDRVAIVSDWAEPSLFDLQIGAGGEEFRRAHGLRGRFLVLHAGNMGVKQGLEVILEAAALSRDNPEIAYLLAGDGAARPALEARAAALGAANVRFLPLQPKAAFAGMLAAADLCLITQRCCVADIVFPSKTLTLMAAGRPLVVSANPGSEVARVVSEARAGLAVAAEDPQALLGAIRALRADDWTRRTMAERGRSYARERWDRNRILAVLEAELLRVAGRGARGKQVA